VVPFERLPHLPRYLKALLVRAERAAVNPAKDQEKVKQILPFRQALQALNPPAAEPARRALEEFRWMLEEFKVSVFAQELGTAQPVSAKRLAAQLQALGQ
jgi:ATP-dependent helicase HrpA